MVTNYVHRYRELSLDMIPGVSLGIEFPPSETYETEDNEIIHYRWGIILSLFIIRFFFTVYDVSKQ